LAEVESIVVSYQILLSNQQQNALFKLIVGDDTDSKLRIIDHNVPLIVKTAKGYSNLCLDLLELI